MKTWQQPKEHEQGSQPLQKRPTYNASLSLYFTSNDRDFIRAVFILYILLQGH